MTLGHTGLCVGNSGAVPRLGFRGMCLEDAPSGIRGPDFVSAFPAGMHVAQTWDRRYMRAYGKALGEEYRGKGVNVALGPVGGGIGRVPRAGRNWEGASPDPYLTGVQMEEIVLGIQGEGVIACSKVKPATARVPPCDEHRLTWASTFCSTSRNTAAFPVTLESRYLPMSTILPSTSFTYGHS